MEARGNHPLLFIVLDWIGLDEIGRETRMRVQNKKKKECSDGGVFFLREGSLYGDGFCVVTASLP